MTEAGFLCDEGSEGVAKSQINTSHACERHRQGRDKQTHKQIYAHSMKNLIYIGVRLGGDEYTELITEFSREDGNETSGFASQGNS